MSRWIPFAVCIGLEIFSVVVGLRDLHNDNPDACAAEMLMATIFAGAALLSMPEERDA